MPYIARKPARFDRPYAIGERIPDGVVDPARAEGLIAMGRIQWVDETEPDQPAGEAQEAAGATESTGGVNAPAEPETAAGEATAAKAAKKKTSAKK